MVDSTDILQRASVRIIRRYLQRQGRDGIETAGRLTSLTGRHVDISYQRGHSRVRIKVKPDPYFGTDPSKINDRDLAFYRLDAGNISIEARADAVGGRQGWVHDSEANELYYHRIAIARPAEEVAALLAEPDEVFFTELRVERDHLLIVPMPELRDWFFANQDRFAPRPVVFGEGTAWHRIVPVDELERSIAGIIDAGPVFATLLV